MRKLPLSLLCLLVAVASFGAPQGESPANPPAKTRLKVAWWGSAARHERTIQVLLMFQRENPSLDIDWDYMNWNDYWTKLTTQAAANNLPNVIQQDYQYLTEWVGRRLIVPLDEQVHSGALDLADVPESSLAGGRVEGSLFGVSLGINSACIMLDADAFRRAGLALPPDDWTWADFERITLSLSRKLGIPAVSGNIVHDHIWRSMYLGKGEWAYTEDGRSLGYPPEDDSVFAEQMRMARRLLAAGAMIPYSEIVAARSKAVDEDWLVKGRSAIAFLWSNQVVAVWTAAGVDARRFELWPLPRLSPTAGSSNYMKPAQFFSITKNAGSAESAARLIDYFTNSIEANKVLLAERGAPIATAVREALKPLLGAPQRVVFDYLDRIQKDVAPVPPPDPVGNTDLINNVFIPLVVDPVMFGRISPEEGMRILRREAAGILAE